MILSSVVLPQPDGLRKQTNSPCPTSSRMSRSAVKAPNSLRIPSSRRKGAAPWITPLLPWLGFRVVALGPLGEDALARLRGLAEIHLHQPLFVILGNVRQRLGDAGLRGDREILAVELHRVLARRPVGELLRGREPLRALVNAECFEVPAEPFLREHEVDRRTFRLVRVRAVLE